MICKEIRDDSYTTIMSVLRPILLLIFAYYYCIIIIIILLCIEKLQSIHKWLGTNKKLPLLSFSENELQITNYRKMRIK